MLTHPLHAAGYDIPPCPMPVSAVGMLNRVRFVASRCRVAPRQDFFATCTALRAPAALGQEAYVAGVLLVLHEALGRRPVFHRAGDAAFTFDEAWLVSLLLAVQRGDADSLAFLIHSRVAADKRWLFSQLIHGLAASLTA